MTGLHPLLTPERLALQTAARRFAAEEVRPVADALDPVKADIPPALLARLAELGYFGIMIGAEHGGMGLGVFEYCLVAEELARAWMSVASIIARAQGLGTQVPDPARRAELLRRSARGDWIGAVALSEPGSGSDLAAVSCRAVRDGGDYVLAGEKRWCGNALASHFISLLARVADAPSEGPRAAGLASFLIEKEPGTLPAGMTGEPIDKIGYHGITSYALHLDGVRVPIAARVGGETGGGETGGGGGAATTDAFRQTMRGLEIARVHTAARAVGLARGALEDSIAYAQARHQFERPISAFQAVRFMVADMATEIETSRSLYYSIAELIDRGASAPELASMAKLQASEMSQRVTATAMQIHGGNGYTTERSVERYWRDARLTTVFEGTSEIQRRIISDSLLPKASR